MSRLFGNPAAHNLSNTAHWGGSGRVGWGDAESRANQVARREQLTREQRVIADAEPAGNLACAGAQQEVVQLDAEIDSSLVQFPAQTVEMPVPIAEAVSA